MTVSLADPILADLLEYAGAQGHRDYPCLSRAHTPSNCIPCRDFSPWLKARVAAGDADAIADYLRRVRQANPPVVGPADASRRHFRLLAERILSAPLERYLAEGSPAAYLDLRTALVILAVHEPFTGYSMTGDAAEFLAAVMAPYSFVVVGGVELMQRRNAFVAEMAAESTYWAGWPKLKGDGLRSPTPPRDAPFTAVLAVLAGLPIGSRAHVADALRHLTTPGVPRSLLSLSRPETRRRGLDVAESTRRILASALVVPSADVGAWLTGWTRRDLLGFLAEVGVRVRNSWSKERLIEVAREAAGEALTRRMAESGTVELAPAYQDTASRLRIYLARVRETWRVWLAFGTGIPAGAED